MERVSDVNNVADRTEAPSGKSWNERATFNDVADERRPRRQSKL
jgi:hypothetical protein